MANAFIQFTSRLKSTTQDGVLAEAQQIAVSASDNTDIKSYVDAQIKAVNGNITSVAGSVYRPKGSLAFAALKALTSAAIGDVYNVTDAFTLGSKSYPAGSNVACIKAFSAAVTPDETYWDVLAGFVDLSPYAKTTDLNTAKKELNKAISDQNTTLSGKITTAQNTANEAKTAATSNTTTINAIGTRVTHLENVGAQANKIEVVKVNGTALTIDSSKGVNIDLSGYATATELSSLATMFGDAIKGNVIIGTGVTLAASANGGALMFGTNGSTPNKELATTAALGNYVTKVAGKGLSTNDYDATDKGKVNSITLGKGLIQIKDDVHDGQFIAYTSGGNKTDGLNAGNNGSGATEIHIGRYTTIGKQVEIGDGTFINSQTTIGTNVVIGTDNGVGVYIGDGVSLRISNSGSLTFGTGNTTTEIATKSELAVLEGAVSAVGTRVGNLEKVGAQVNVLESVKVNGTALAISGKAVNIPVATANVVTGEGTVGVISVSDLLSVKKSAEMVSLLTAWDGTTAATKPLKVEAVKNGGYNIGLIQDGNTYVGGEIPLATAQAVGLMSAQDKEDLDYLNENAATSSDVEALQKRVTALENLLKLA